MVSRKTPAPVNRLTIEFLYLDRTRCTRCRETNDSLDAALAEAADALQRAGAEVEVRKTQVQTAEQARAVGFVSSPTIRINGRDIALELKESPCEDCGCGCDEQVLCRVWTYRGREYTSAPKDLILDAIRHAALAAPADERRPVEVPKNLKQFFAAKGATACCG